MDPMTPSSDPIADAFGYFRQGDITQAYEIVRTALVSVPNDPQLNALAGLFACQKGDASGGIVHLEKALLAMPGDHATRINLASALTQIGDFERVTEVCVAGGNDVRLRRIAAYACQQLGDLDAAIGHYRAVVAEIGSDFESWNNLGNVLAARDEIDPAIDAFERAIALRRDIPMLYVNFSKALATWDRHEDRQRVMRAAVSHGPSSSEVQTELGLAEAAARDFEAAERAYREAIRLSEGFTPAWVELGILFENLNRVDDLVALVGDAEAKGFTDEQIGFIKAWSLRRQGRLTEALPIIETTSAQVDPVRRYQLEGEILDRLGKAGRAFAAFTSMNQAVRVSSYGAKMQGGSYLKEVEATAARMTSERVAQWTKVDIASTPPAPVFIIGFPRSGTTLTDTLLMNIPHFHVLEELPVLRQVEMALGDPGRIESLSSTEASALRARYFEVLEEIAPPQPGQTIIDKFPLHMARVPLIHRIFPDAKFVFVERHPYDSVLSCFMSNFQPNRAVINFLKLNDAARLYDAVFEAWQRSENLLPLNVHRVRYERMVDNLEDEMRPLLAFLGVEWDPAVLDNQASAARRAHIRTASYSQVTEPIYRRAAGRWTRYREQITEILPILAPWAERMGYPTTE